MRKHPTPYAQRKKNKRSRIAPRYHVEICDSFWKRFDAKWMDLPPYERQHRMMQYVENIRVFLNKRRPKRTVELLVTPKGKVSITPNTRAWLIRAKPIDDAPSGRVLVTEYTPPS